MKAIVFVPLYPSLPCANWSTSFVNDFSQTILYFSIFIRCRYSSALPVSGSITAWQKIPMGEYISFLNASWVAKTFTANPYLLICWTGSLVLTTFGDSSKMMELLMCVALLLSVYRGWAGVSMGLLDGLSSSSCEMMAGCEYDGILT